MAPAKSTLSSHLMCGLEHTGYLHMIWVRTNPSGTFMWCWEGLTFSCLQVSPVVFFFSLSIVILSIRKPISPPRTPVSHSSASSPLTTVGRGDGGGAAMPKHGGFMLRAPHPSQASELYYQEPHSAYDTGHYQPSCELSYWIKNLN